MPKETFFNLPDKKREMIENAAIEEFAEQGYDNASINRIVEACKIAKGSFYQYFEDKKDVLMHLMDITAKTKIASLSTVLENSQDLDFFELMRELWFGGLKFASENQNLARLGNEIMKNQNRGIYKEILDSKGGMATDFYRHLIVSAVVNGELRKDLDIEYISYMLTALGIATIEYYFNNVLNEDIQFTKINENMMEAVDLFIDLLKNGIANKN
jgi:AcrR family transcriptional regulator